MELSGVDLVRRGANQKADICFFQSADPAEIYNAAIIKFFQSIRNVKNMAEISIGGTGNNLDD